MLLAPVLAFAMWPSPRLRWRSLAGPVAAGLVALSLVTPWSAYASTEFGRFVPLSSQTGTGLAGTYNDESRLDPDCPACWRGPIHVAELRPLFFDRRLDEAEQDVILRGRVMDVILRHPAYVGEVFLRHSARMLGAGGLAYERMSIAAPVPDGLLLAGLIAFWLLALLALYGAFTRLARSVPGFVWVIAPLMFASAAFVLGTSRYRMALEPFVVLLATAGLVTAFRRARATATTAIRSPKFGLTARPAIPVLPSIANAARSTAGEYEERRSA